MTNSDWSFNQMVKTSNELIASIIRQQDEDCDEDQDDVH